jgi:transposase-like protein
MYLNNCGIRKTALFIGCSRTTVMNWVRDAKHQLDEILKDFEPNYSEQPDIIEFDEIYTYVQKNRGASSFGLLTLGTQSVLLRL